MSIMLVRDRGLRGIAMITRVAMKKVLSVPINTLGIYLKLKKLIIRAWKVDEF